MPTPITPVNLRALIPGPNSALCGRMIPGLTEWMQEVTSLIEYEYDKDGKISCEFAADLCAISCVGGTDPTVTCPDVTFYFTVTENNTELVIAANVSNMGVGWTANLYRSVTSGVFADPAISTQTTTGSSFTYTDTGRTNGTLYYYKLTVQKGGCTDLIGYTQGTPSLCKVLPMAIALNTSFNGIVAGQIMVRVTGGAAGVGIPTGSAYTIFRSTAIDQIGTSIATGVVGDATNDCDQDNGLQGICYLDSELDGCTNYFYTVQVRQDPACVLYTMTAQGMAYNPAPSVHTALTVKTALGKFQTQVVRYVTWNAAPGVTYSIFRVCQGDLCNNESFHPQLVGSTSSGRYDLPVSNGRTFSNTSGVIGGRAYYAASYRYYVVADNCQGANAAKFLSGQMQVASYFDYFDRYSVSEPYLGGGGQEGGTTPAPATIIGGPLAGVPPPPGGGGYQIFWT